MREGACCGAEAPRVSGSGGWEGWGCCCPGRGCSRCGAARCRQAAGRGAKLPMAPGRVPRGAVLALLVFHRFSQSCVDGEGLRRVVPAASGTGFPPGWGRRFGLCCSSSSLFVPAPLRCDCGFHATGDSTAINVPLVFLAEPLEQRGSSSPPQTLSATRGGGRRSGRAGPSPARRGCAPGALRSFPPGAAGVSRGGAAPHRAGPAGSRVCLPWRFAEPPRRPSPPARARARACARAGARGRCGVTLPRPAPPRVRAAGHVPFLFLPQVLQDWWSPRRG